MEYQLLGLPQKTLSEKVIEQSLPQPRINSSEIQELVSEISKYFQAEELFEKNKAITFTQDGGYVSKKIYNVKFALGAFLEIARDSASSILKDALEGDQAKILLEIGVKIIINSAKFISIEISDLDARILFEIHKFNNLVTESEIFDNLIKEGIRVSKSEYHESINRLREINSVSIEEGKIKALETIEFSTSS